MTTHALRDRGVARRQGAKLLRCRATGSSRPTTAIEGKDTAVLGETQCEQPRGSRRAPGGETWAEAMAPTGAPGAPEAPEDRQPACVAPQRWQEAPGWRPALPRTRGPTPSSRAPPTQATGHHLVDPRGSEAPSPRPAPPVKHGDALASARHRPEPRAHVANRCPPCTLHLENETTKERCLLGEPH